MNLEQKIALMQNPIGLVYLGHNPGATFYGTATRIRYRAVGGEAVMIDERDVAEFLSFEKNRKRLFIVAPVDEPEVEAEEEEIEVLVIGEPSVESDVDDLTVIKGIGPSTQATLYEFGVLTYEGLNNLTMAGMNELFKVDEEKYLKIKEELQELI